MDLLMNIASAFIGNKVNHLQSFKENMNKLKRKYEELDCRKEDVEAKMIAELHQGKRQKKEVEFWLANVERIKSEKECIENEIKESRFLRRASLGELLIEKIQEVDELYQKGSFSDGLVVDAPPDNEEILGSTASAITAEREMNEIQRNDDVGKNVVYGIGGIGDVTITNSFHNINYLHI
ncbi:hypothetical protein L1049_012435 [Liquidambar formosana]|uniref:Disease resistance protein n=1 Tax=Liquidambar formosana TaxID=63359 RepID=A0AAP0N5M7_LIQFO